MFFWQKGLGVSHNSPQADKVLPWSIQLSKSKCLTAFKKDSFLLFDVKLLLGKNKRTDLPLLYKGKSALIYKEITSKFLPTATSVSSICCSYAIVQLGNLLSFFLQCLKEFHHKNTNAL